MGLAMRVRSGPSDPGDGFEHLGQGIALQAFEGLARQVGPGLGGCFGNLVGRLTTWSRHFDMVLG